MRQKGREFAIVPFLKIFRSFGKFVVELDPGPVGVAVEIGLEQEEVADEDPDEPAGQQERPLSEGGVGDRFARYECVCQEEKERAEEHAPVVHGERTEPSRGGGEEHRARRPGERCGERGRYADRIHPGGE